MNDGTLLLHFRTGNHEDSFREIVQRHLGPVRGPATDGALSQFSATSHERALRGLGVLNPAQFPQETPVFDESAIISQRISQNSHAAAHFHHHPRNPPAHRRVG